MNAILQCVVHTPLLKSYFISGSFKEHINKKLAAVNEGIFSEVVAEFAKEYEKLNDPIGSLRKVKTAMGKYIPHFQGYDQHDAQEFLAMMIDKLTEELTILISGNMSKTAPAFDAVSSPIKTPDTKDSKEVPAIKSEGDVKVSVMGDLFCGELCTTVTCPHCSNLSEKKETFYYLSVPLPQEDTYLKFACVKRCNGDDIPLPINVVSLKVQRTTCLGTVLKEIAQDGEMHESSILLAEVSRSKIVRRITGDPKSTLSAHRLAQGAEIYAYEVFASPEQCKILFPARIKEIQYEPGELVDVFDPDAKEWKIGKIQHKSLERAAELSILVEGSGQTPNKEIRIPKFSRAVAPFMFYTTNYNEVEILPLYHRYMRRDGTLAYFGMPKLVAVGAWATCSQVVGEVLMQTKHFTPPDMKPGHGVKIRPFMSIVGGGAKGKKPDPPLRTPTLGPPKMPSVFTVTMIDTSSDTCAICNSRMLAAKKFLYSAKPKQCRGCNLLDYPDTPIKFLVNYFGSVALCVDWKNQADYIEPKFKSGEGTRPGSEQNRFQPTLEDCFKLFTAKEKIANYKCDKCGKEGTADLQVLISKLPDILIVHLKRFLFTDNYVEKLSVKVKFPLQKLNMHHWLTGTFGSSFSSTFASKGPLPEYDLYAIANHHSSTASGGHYTAFIKSEQCEEAWVECDDTTLKGMGTANVVTKDAYLLFYKRRVMSASNIINLTYQAFT